MIVNQSLNTGIFPNKLKIAKVIPVYKKDDETCIENYRPISILPAISKIIEKVIYLQIHKHFLDNNLYFSSQYGFRESHSTELAILEVVDRITYDMDKGKTPINIFMDLSKAFDSINHEILLEKLNMYGLKGVSLSLIQNYLYNRKQYVQIGDIKSELLPITTGVPQGSILGPLFFIIYINDISFSSQLFKFIIYADDTTLYTALQYDKDFSTQSEAMLNMELQKISRWIKLNKLSLNISKTKCMMFHRTQKKIVPPTLHIDGINLQYVNDFSLLGIKINKNMNWSTHKKYIGKKLIKTTCILSKLRHFLSQDILKLIYNALINSHLNYGILCWGFNCTDIQKIQKRAIRTICNSRYNAHTEPLFKQLHILKVTDILTRKIYKFYYRIQNKIIPEYFSKTFNLTKQTDIHSHNTRNKLYVIPKIKHKFAEFNLRYKLPIELNKNIHNILEKINTHSEFGLSVYIKNYYLSNYSVECQIQHCFICNN